MERIEREMRGMTFEFFGSGKHKTDPARHFGSDNALMLDVRSTEESQTVPFELKHHLPVLEIPVNEIPDRMEEIPKDRDIGIFCPASVRASMVYLYLRANDYDRVRILEGGYGAIMDEIKPGKLLKRIKKNE